MLHNEVPKLYRLAVFGLRALLTHLVFLLPKRFTVFCDGMTSCSQEASNRGRLRVLHALAVGEIQRSAIVVVYPEAIIVAVGLRALAHEHIRDVPYAL